VPAYTCSHCGGSNPSFALNCQWCGASLPPPPLTSVPSGLPLPSESPSDQSENDESATTQPSGMPLWVRGVALVIFLIVIVAVAVSQSPSSQPGSGGTPLPSGPAYPVNVTVIDLKSSVNACGLNGTTERGYLGVTNAFSGEIWHVTGTPGGCTIEGLTAVTSGFQVLSLDVPVSLAAGETAAVTVSFGMMGLGGPYTGPLVISVS